MDLRVLTESQKRSTVTGLRRVFVDFEELVLDANGHEAAVGLRRIFGTCCRKYSYNRLPRATVEIRY